MNKRRRHRFRKQLPLCKGTCGHAVRLTRLGLGYCRTCLEDLRQRMIAKLNPPPTFPILWEHLSPKDLIKTRLYVSAPSGYHGEVDGGSMYAKQRQAEVLMGVDFADLEIRVAAGLTAKIDFGGGPVNA